MADTTPAELAREAAAVAQGHLVTAILRALIDTLAEAGEGGLDVGVVRDAHQAAAVALLDAAGVVETAPGRRLRLTEETRRRLLRTKEALPC